MDDIALNPDLFDPFRSPLLLGILCAWLAVIIIWRKRPMPALAGLIVIYMVAWRPVSGYVVQSLPKLVAHTKVTWQRGTTAWYREQDPVYRLLQLYVAANPAYPLAIVDDPGGEATRWARYYLFPRPVLPATAEALASAAPAPGEPPRYALSRGMPALPAELDLSIEGRYAEWVLFKVRKSSSL